jgi:ubiquinone/menaquinone biosynthesis C-methylase UbiE
MLTLEAVELLIPVMNTTDARFAGSIPAVYDRYLRSLLFEPYADDLVARLRDLNRAVVLELAAGTGVVTHALAKALPDGVRIVATDLNDAMLQVAAAGTKAPSVTWKQADAQQLPFDNAEFDVVVCQFGIMFLPDKQAGYREARRVLKPGGRFIFNVWDRLEDNEVSWIAAQAVASVFPDNPPRFYERTPFGYFDPTVIRDQLQMAGFRSIAIETVDKTTQAASPHDAAVGLCQGTPLRNEIEARDPHRLSEATDRTTEAIAARFGSGSFENRMRALVITASSGERWPASDST